MSSGIFSGVPIGGKLVVKSADYSKYLHMMEGVDMVITLKESAKNSPKAKLMNYFHSVVVDYLIAGYTNAGYSGVTEWQVKHEMKTMFACDAMLDIRGRGTKVLIDLSAMPKSRLLKFVKDVLFFMEEEFQIEPPDSEQYLKMKHGKD